MGTNMNQFINDYNDSLECAGFISKDEEQELIEYILEESQYTDMEEFTSTNITYDDALNLVQSSDSFNDDVYEWLSHQPSSGLADHFVSELTESPNAVESIAYSLAYEHTELGTKLLQELLYYQYQGRL